MLLLKLMSHITFTTYFDIDYDLIFIASRLIDFGADEHEYDEVQDFPEESTANNQSLLPDQEFQCQAKTQFYQVASTITTLTYRQNYHHQNKINLL